MVREHKRQQGAPRGRLFSRGWGTVGVTWCQGAPPPPRHTHTAMCLFFRVLSTYLPPIRAPTGPLGQGLAPDIMPALGLALADPGKGGGAVGRQVLVHLPGVSEVRGALDQHPSGHGPLWRQRPGRGLVDWPEGATRDTSPKWAGKCTGGSPERITVREGEGAREGQVGFRVSGSNSPNKHWPPLISPMGTVDTKRKVIYTPQECDPCTAHHPEVRPENYVTAKCPGPPTLSAHLN